MLGTAEVSVAVCAGFLVGSAVSLSPASLSLVPSTDCSSGALGVYGSGDSFAELHWLDLACVT